MVLPPEPSVADSFENAADSVGAVGLALRALDSHLAVREEPHEIARPGRIDPSPLPRENILVKKWRISA
jgi:hypothetical protein